MGPQVYKPHQYLSHGREYIVSVRKFTATSNTGDFRSILPHSVMYGAIQGFVRYERFQKILHEDCVFMDPVRKLNAPVRQRTFIFVRKHISPDPSYIGGIMNFQTDTRYLPYVDCRDWDAVVSGRQQAVMNTMAALRKSYGTSQLIP